jgi:hypothetical protein
VDQRTCKRGHVWGCWHLVSGILEVPFSMDEPHVMVKQAAAGLCQEHVSRSRMKVLRLSEDASTKEPRFHGAPTFGRGCLAARRQLYPPKGGAIVPFLASLSVSLAKHVVPGRTVVEIFRLFLDDSPVPRKAGTSGSENPSHDWWIRTMVDSIVKEGAGQCRGLRAPHARHSPGTGELAH